MILSYNETRRITHGYHNENGSCGGTGGIGEGVVQAFLSAGYRVYVPVRDEDLAERLRAFVHDSESLRILPADIGDDLAILAMRERVLEEVPQIDAVVVSVGAGYWGHRLHKMPRTDWDDSIVIAGASRLA